MEFDAEEKGCERIEKSKLNETLVPTNLALVRNSIKTAQILFAIISRKSKKKNSIEFNT